MDHIRLSGVGSMQPSLHTLMLYLTQIGSFFVYTNSKRPYFSVVGELTVKRATMLK